MALAYLPPNNIPQSLCTIIGNINNPEVFKKMQKFFNYYIKQWIKAREPEEWSQFYNIRRTNNATESWNRDLNAKFGKHPSIWKLTRKLVEEQNIAYREYLAIMALKKRQRGQIENRRKSCKVQDLNDQLTSRLISPTQFLEFATQLVTFRRSNLDETSTVQINDEKRENDEQRGNDNGKIENEIENESENDEQRGNDNGKIENEIENESENEVENESENEVENESENEVNEQEDDIEYEEETSENESDDDINGGNEDQVPVKDDILRRIRESTQRKIQIC
ncbi:putative uncharacterized protein DDB_G0289963 [Microplitis mediator]|uniref:putative uncharacterized protein DDB_G0289963 n=1 Tax=Microplitis mediator TaxID=375433 RepID=UPI00255218EE|nr:putative uncharacterized protein DDB_G0289963 [Microplitis mediator]XP_057336101.1 putative uncharacterized protein DDB_G0289963 [Microplitis mediator]